jgi:hypothetical protein
MNFILKAALAGAIAAGVFNALLRRQVAQQADAFQRLRVGDHVPTVNPEEPLEDLDLRIAQNAPL